MTTSSGDDLYLGDLADRLAGGVLPAIRASRQTDRPDQDTALLAEGLWKCTAPDQSFFEPTGLSPGQIDTHVANIAKCLQRKRPLLLAVLYSPDSLVRKAFRIDSLPADCSFSSLFSNSRNTGDLSKRTVGQWLPVCWLAEAAWQCLQKDLQQEMRGEFTPSDVPLLTPLAARLRFLVLSEPLRHRTERPGKWMPSQQDYWQEIEGAHGLLGRVFGNSSWHQFVGRCREARWEWRRCLDEYQSHPLLAQASGRQIEEELAALVFADHKKRALLLRTVPLADPASPSEDDRMVAADVLESHLLPRFDLHTTWRLARALRAAEGDGRVGERAYQSTAQRIRSSLSNHSAWLMTGVTLVVVAAALSALTLAMLRHPRWAALVTAGCYVIIGVGTVLLGRLWAALWLLRLPAAGAVGMFALISLGAGWLTHAEQWQSSAWWASLTLIGAAYGYLLIQARNHRVEGRSLVLRTAAVGTIGLLHAALVAVLGLVLVAPPFLADTVVHELWNGRGSKAWTVLGLAAAWNLAVGVFSQILWQDRPVTAPLAHARWRRSP